MSLARLYPQLAKDYHVEELPDLLLFRPLGFLLVMLIRFLPVTPNQISMFSVVIGVVSAWFFSRGDHAGFIAGGLGYGLANTLDCCDGMIARLKHNGSLMGRTIDGLADALAGLAVHIGLAVGLTKAVAAGSLRLPFNPVLLVALAGISALIQSVFADKYRNRYETHALGRCLAPEKELEFFTAERNRLREGKGRQLRKFLVALNIAYSSLQAGGRKQAFVRFDSQEYRRRNGLLVMLWNLLGPTTHIFVLIVAALLYRPGLYLLYAIILSQVWMAFLLVWQKRADTHMPLTSGADV